MPDDSLSRYCHSLPGLNRLLEVTRLLAQEIDTAKESRYFQQAAWVHGGIQAQAAGLSSSASLTF